MKPVCIIIPYFGKLPKNIITFLMSCKKNRSINWIIFTNDPIMFKLQHFCRNVLFIKSNISSIKDRLVKATGINNIKLNKPYKLCDYKPLYGKMFSDYLKGYKYWGYSDIDVVYGNLWKYINYGIRHNYEKIGNLGHFTLIRNTISANNRYKLPIIKDGHKIYLFNDIVAHTDKGLAFDEWQGIDNIYAQYHINTYCNPNLVNEIMYTNLDLNTRDNQLYKTKRQLYTWQNGHAIFYYYKNNKIENKEYGYFHFQKRRVFDKFIKNSQILDFSITTHGYNVLPNLNRSTIQQGMEMNKSSYLNRLKYKLHWYFFTGHFATRMHIGHLRLPIKFILKCIFNQDFKVFKV